MALDINPALSFRSSDRALEAGFDRIKSQALYWVFDGDPVGPWYEAALPGRAAFCMRDVSHQCFGAEMLGLHKHNLNMFRKFAEGISASKDWCTFWEIDRFDRPCPVDYANDADFWYNLPANFDLLDAMYRMYKVSGDLCYLKDKVMMSFRAHTMESYVNRWDRDGDGILDRVTTDGRRGLVSYDESAFAGKELLYGTDLIGAMIRGYRSESAFSKENGFAEIARIYLERAVKLQSLLDDVLYEPARGYAAGMGMEGRPVYHPDAQSWSLLYWGVVPPDRCATLLAYMERTMDEAQIEAFSHYPELFFRYGRPKLGLRALRRAMHPDLPRKEYPEASFCAIGALASGLMGLMLDAPSRSVRTEPGLTDIEWAELRHIPFPHGELHLLHKGQSSSLDNATEEAVIWTAYGQTVSVPPHTTRELWTGRQKSTF